jgi:hypothetical protein
MATNLVATITAQEAQAGGQPLPERSSAGSFYLQAVRRLMLPPVWWREPVRLAHPFIGPVGQTGEILVSATSEEIVSYTPLEGMKAAARKL